MKPGQLLTNWWQRYVLGELKSPQDIVRAAFNETPDNARPSERFFGTPEDDALFAAPERLSAPGFYRSEAYLKQWDRADWQNCDPRLMRWSAMLIQSARKRNIPLYVHSAFRTEAEQAALVAAGRSKAPYPRSAHNIGEAVDIVHGVYHWDLTPQEWALIHTLGRLALDRLNATLKQPDKLHLTWGGTFEGFYDPAHWQIEGYRARIKRLPVGPPVRYTPRRILDEVNPQSKPGPRG